MAASSGVPPHADRFRSTGAVPVDGLPNTTAMETVMPQIGQFTRETSGFTGRIATFTLFRDIAIVPLATPLLAGPGAISTVILYASHSPGAVNYALLTLIVVLVGATTLLSLRLALPLARRMKETGVDIASRMMGLLVTAIALELIVSGLTQLLPALGTVR